MGTENRKLILIRKRTKFILPSCEMLLVCHVMTHIECDAPIRNFV